MASELSELRLASVVSAERIGHTPRFLVGKPGLDGHSNGAEQIAVRARDVGMDVIYQGIRLTPEEIVATAQQEDVDASVSASCPARTWPWCRRCSTGSRSAGMGDVPLVVGGIIPDDDARELRGSAWPASTRPRIRAVRDHGRHREAG